MKKKVGEYIMEELIGSGAYGEVYRGSSTKSPGETFAIKMISKKNMSEKVFHYLEREVEILQMLDHENVVKLKDIRATENHYYLIFEHCNGGDLSSFRKKRGGTVKQETVRFVLKQIVSGLNAVYIKKAIHRDIKLSNVLLYYPNEEARTRERPIVKLGDFGFARLVKQVEGNEPSIIEEPELMSFVGTPLNMAPELFHKKPYSFKADIWSLGTIVYELLCGQNCYTGINKEDLMHNIDKGVYRIPKSLNLSTECLDFINACLQLNPTNRIKWKLLREHQYVIGEKATPFSLETFNAMNTGAEGPFEDHDNYIFSSKVRYVFFPQGDKGNTALATIAEEDKMTADMKKLQVNDKAPSPKADAEEEKRPKETPQPAKPSQTTGTVEDEDYVKVERPETDTVPDEAVVAEIKTEGEKAKPKEADKDEVKEFTATTTDAVKITEEDHFK